MNTETHFPKGDFPVWGLFSTLVWSLIIATLFVATQSLMIGIYIGINYGDVAAPEFEQLMTELQFNGVVISICTFASLLVCGLAILGIVKLKKNSSIKHYLGFLPVSRRDLIFWLVVMSGLIVVSDLITFSLGKPIVPEFMTSVYASTEQTWLLWIALIIAAPLFEELFFRGFVISGIAPTVLGPIGAVVISAASWAAIHFQYDLYCITSIFVMGLALGTARIKTGSILLTIGLHSFANLIATIETVIKLS